MMLFIGYIPAHTTERDFVRFITSASRRLLSWTPFVAKPTLRKCQVLRIEDQQEQTVEYHGLVSIQPTKATLNILQKLNGRKFKGRSVEVRRYFKRSFRMDRRNMLADSGTLAVERRRGDRRRQAIRSQIRPC